MKLGKFVVALMIFVTLSPYSRAAVEDTAIEAAAQEYRSLLTAAREAGERPNQADMGDYVDKAMAKIPLDQLTPSQLQQAMSKLPVIYSTKTAPAISKILDTLAEGKAAEGARAAIIKLQLLPQTTKPEELLPKLEAVLSHPGVSDALSKGYGAELFAQASNLSAEAMLKVQPALLALGSQIQPSASVNLLVSGSSFFHAVARTLKPDEVKGYAPLREQFAKAVAEKLAGTVTDQEKSRLQGASATLNGAFARGELIGSKAPPLDFIWFTDPGDPSKQIKSLDDLKGKVVVLDFWATWCGPCIASFPKVKALSRYYRGFDVVVLGVTSVQGFHIAPSGRIDTKDDPQKEFGLMPDFIKEKEIAWPIAFSKQPVFNPDYGVRGIPSVVIIDPNGIVRQAGLHPAQPLEEKTAIIDKLLSEAKLTVPAQMLMQKKED